MSVYRYCQCKRSAEAPIQYVSHGYVFYSICAYCDMDKSFDQKVNHADDFEEHFNVFEIYDRFHKGIFEKHIGMIKTDPEKYKVENIL